MSKLQRTIDGQTLAFITLPRIFNSLSADLPSGRVHLTPELTAYWRLNRNPAHLKKTSTTIRSCAAHLARAFRSMIESQAFLNHYGIQRPPVIANEDNLTKMFVQMLQMNTNRVEQSSISHGGNTPLTETISYWLGQQVQFIATRGEARSRDNGLSGSLWLTTQDQRDGKPPYSFTIVSSVINLAEYMSQDRLMTDIAARLRTNLPATARSPVVVFNDGQFENYFGNGLKALAEKNPHPKNGEGKKKSALVQPPVTAAEFTSLVEKDMIDRVKAGQYAPIVGESIPDAETAAQTAEAITDAKKAAEVDKLISEMGEDGSDVLVLERAEEAPESFGATSTVSTNLAEKINAIAPAARGANTATFAVDDAPFKVNATPKNFEVGTIDGTKVGRGLTSDAFMAEAIDAPVSLEFATAVANNNQAMVSAVSEFPSPELQQAFDKVVVQQESGVAEAFFPAAESGDPLHLKTADGMWSSMFYEQYDAAKFDEGTYVNLIGDDGAKMVVVKSNGAWTIKEPDHAPDNSYKLAP